MRQYDTTVYKFVNNIVNNMLYQYTILLTNLFKVLSYCQSMSE
jgi:hypothetical protein